MGLQEVRMLLQIFISEASANLKYITGQLEVNWGHRVTHEGGYEGFSSFQVCKAESQSKKINV
jgi:hypothetical protein